MGRTNERDTGENPCLQLNKVLYRDVLILQRIAGEVVQ
jgi:hypothetical protein